MQARPIWWKFNRENLKENKNYSTQGVMNLLLTSQNVILKIDMEPNRTRFQRQEFTSIKMDGCQEEKVQINGK